MDPAPPVGAAVKALHACVVCLLLGAWPAAGAADRYAVVVTGASGGTPYAEKYDGWRNAFVATLQKKLGYPPDHIVVLAEQAAPPVRRATREDVRTVFQDLAKRVTKDDVLLVLLIGHGTSGDEGARFNLVGPDLTAAEWAGLIKPIAGRVVFVNAASGSFEFLEALAGRGRIVLTAADSAAQQYETVFPQFFIEAFAAEEADLDRDGRVSILEAFQTASAGVTNWFEEQGRLATERPVLDDNGDGIGREAAESGPDGQLAQVHPSAARRSGRWNRRRRARRVASPARRPPVAHRASQSRQVGHASRPVRARARSARPRARPARSANPVEVLSQSMDLLARDFRLAARHLRTAWPFALATVLTLSLGIGANVTLFSLADSVIFRPLPLHEAEQLVIAGESRSEIRAEVSYLNFKDWQVRTRAFESLAAMGSSDWPVTLLDGEPVAVAHRAVSGDFFTTLGIQAAMGRTIAAGDDQRGAAGALVISHGLWQRAFGGDPTIVGRAITLNDGPVTVVGVMPRGFTYPFGTDAWSALVPALAGIGQPELPNFLATREAAVLHVVGRLKRDVSVAAARADLDRVIREVSLEYGIADMSSSRIRPLVDELLGQTRTACGR